MPQGIYAIENTLTGDVYVGSTRALEKRKRRHFLELKQGIHHSTYLQRAYDKYGVDAFVFRVIEEVLDANLLLQREQYWIETLHPAYNMNPLATNSLGMKVSEETKQRLLHYSMMRTPEQRKGMLGKQHSEETKRKMAEKASQRTHTEETKQKMRTAKLGKKQSEEHIQKRAAKRQGHEVSEEARRSSSEKNKAYWQNLSEEERRIRSEQARNRPPISEETRQRQREAKLGKKQSEELIQKRVNGRKAKQQQ